MSLLLEALKKAERAKQEAQRRARAEPGGEPEELQGQAAAAAPASALPAAPVTTRAQLPEISPKLEIVSDDLLDKPASERAPPAPPRDAAPSPAASAAEARASEEAGRASARKVFEA